MLVSASDIIKALEAVPGWKAVIGLPKRLAELESRVKALEQGAIKPDTGATTCPRCGATMTFLDESGDRAFAAAGGKIRHFKCDGCDFAADRKWSASKGYF